MLVFNRQSYSELWITIQAGESLSVLDSGYIEDYFGTDGQLTLRNMADDTRISFAMTEDVDETPFVSHDVFTGFVDLTVLPDGIYRVEGRVRDSLGNYRILSDFQNPSGTEDVTLFEIEITPLSIVVRIPKVVQLFQVEKPEGIVVFVDKPDVDLELVDSKLSIDFKLIGSFMLDIELKEAPLADISLITNPEIDILNVYTNS
jgi:hypothetical protein